MIYGISTHFLGENRLTEDIIQMISDKGFDTIELFYNMLQLDMSDVRHCEKVVNAINRQGLYVNSVHAPFYFVENGARSNTYLDIASTDSQLRQKSLDEIKQSFMLGMMMEIDYFIIHFPDNADENILLDSVNELGKMADNMKFKLCFENIPGEKTDVKSIASFIEKHMLPVGICFDTGHSFLNRSIQEDIVNYGVDFYTMHVHDNNGEHDSHLMPFKGGMDWMGMMKALKSVQYKWGFMLEIKSEPGEQLKQTLNHAARTVDTFRNMEKSLR